MFANFARNFELRVAYQFYCTLMLYCPRDEKDWLAGKDLSAKLEKLCLWICLQVQSMTLFNFVVYKVDLVVHFYNFVLIISLS